MDFQATFEHVEGDPMLFRKELGQVDLDDDGGFAEASVSGGVLVVRVLAGDRREQWRLSLSDACATAARAARVIPASDPGVEEKGGCA